MPGARNDCFGSPAMMAANGVGVFVVVEAVAI